MKRRHLSMMTDTSLLSRRDWRYFTDEELKRAVGLARWHARLAFKDRRARVEQGGDWSLLEERANAVIYLAYAAFQNDECDMSEWDGCSYAELINDPRVYEFCTQYDTYQRRFMGWPRLKENKKLLMWLIGRRGQDLVVSERSLRANQNEYARQTIAWQQMNEPILEAMTQGHSRLLNEFLLYRMLWNSSMEKWLEA